MEWVEIVRDLNAGTVGGVAGIVAGHPLDTIKVHLQTSCPKMLPSSPFQLVQTIAASEGILGFYKGMLSPILSNAPINAVVFAAYGQTTRLFTSSANSNLSLSQQFLAGSAAGCLQTIFAAPSELVKIQAQTCKNAVQINSIERARQIYRRFGLEFGLFRGWRMTVARDAPAFGIYFSAYEATKSALTNDEKSRETDFNLMMAGGIAGSLSWLLLHPVDVVKTQVQSADLTHRQPLRQIIQQNYQAQGLSFFWKGFGATMLRAFPVSAVTFLVYERTMDFLADRT